MSDVLSKFLAIWEVEPHFKCPVVGALLSVNKHKSVLKKCGYDISGLKPYEYHQVIMSNLHEENDISKKINSFVRSQARKWMLKIADMSEEEIRTLWEKNVESGNVGPLMYAIVSHEGISMDLLQDVYGEVHMKAHANMTGIFKVSQQLDNAKTTIDREKKKFRLKTDENRQLVKLRKNDARKISGLETENARLQKQIKKMAASSFPDPSQDGIIQKLKDHVADLTSRLEDRKKAVQSLKEAHFIMKMKHMRLKDENQAIHQEMETFIAALENMAPPCQTNPDCRKENCSQYRLCARRIFMIGGITKMKSHYKNIIEKAGGEFDYHDGYIKSAGGDIEAKVKRSDLVLCPVNCNSHNACIRVKKLCNQHKTPLKILSSSSLSAVSQAVFSQETTAPLS